MQIKYPKLVYKQLHQQHIILQIDWMGNSQKASASYNQKCRILLQIDAYFQNKLWKQLGPSSFNTFSIVPQDDQDRLKFTPILQQIRKSQIQSLNIAAQLQLNFIFSRAVSCLLGLGIGDTLGSYTQYSQYSKQSRNLISYDINSIKQQIKNQIFETPEDKVGIWTDDCSIALCIADSLLLKYKFSPKHIRFMIQMWSQHGLNNGGRNKSMHITNNIAQSILNFSKIQQQYPQYVQKSDTINNGNEPLARIAPIALFYSKNEIMGMQTAKNFTRITQNGEQIKQCSRLLTLILIKLINRQQNESWRNTIDEACEDFVHKLKTIPSVACLAQSKKQSIDLYQSQLRQHKQKFKRLNKTPDDRNWNWKSQNFTYSKNRVKDQCLHIGSYCMDALAMALHIVWFSSSSQQILLKAANMGGNCSSVGAIAGQIGGAIYGLDKYIMHVYSQMQDCKSGRFQLFLIAHKLIAYSQK